MYIFAHLSLVSIESLKRAGVEEKRYDYAQGENLSRHEKADNLSFCVWSNGGTRIRSEYIEETPFSRLLRASAWHLISRESYWHFDRRSARYLVFAFPALIQLESSEWSHERWTRTTNRIIHCFRVFNYCNLLFPRGGIRAICQPIQIALSKILSFHIS